MSEKKEIRLKDETEFLSVLKEVKKESRLQETEQYIQHGVTSVYRHSLAVAYFSCYLAEKLHLKVRTKEMILEHFFMIISFMTGMKNRMITVCMVSLIRPGH